LRHVFCALLFFAAALPAQAAPFAYVVNYGSGTVSVIDTASNTVIKTLNVGANPMAIAVKADATRAYVVNYYGDSVSVIDTINNEVIATVTVGDAPSAIAVSKDGKRAYVVNDASKTVSVLDIDAASNTPNTVIASVSVAPSTGFTGIVVSPDGARVYVLHEPDGNDLAVINTSDNAVIHYPVDFYYFYPGTGALRGGVAINADGTRIYAAGAYNNISNVILVIDTSGATPSLVTAAAGVRYPYYGIALNPAATKVYAVNYSLAVMYAMDTTSLAVTSIYFGGVSPHAVAVHPAGTRVYVTTSANTVRVINAADNTLMADSMAVGADPYAIAILNTVPDAPSIGAASGGVAQVSAAFSAPAFDGGSAISGYTATCSAAGQPTKTGSGSTSPIAVTGLANGVAYTCSVTASNAVGTGAASATVAVATIGTVPSAPLAVAASGGNAQASVSFSAPADNGGLDISGYTATCAANGQTTRSSSGSTSPITVTGLANGVAYACNVFATNAVGNSGASANASVTPATVPDAPTGISATRGNALATINFTAPAFNGGATLTGYTATCSANGQATRTATGTGSSLTVLDLNNGVAYTCSVTASNSKGSGAASATASVTPATVPDAPGITAAALGNGSAAVSFTAPASNGGAAITGYSATCGGTSASGVSPIVINGLSNGTTYSCSVVAVNDVGSSASSSSLSVTPATIPDAPSNIAATRGNAQATVSFTAPSGNGGAALTGYSAICSASGQTTRSTTGSGTSLVVSDLSNGVAYSCRATANNSIGSSIASAAASVTPATVPDAPGITAVAAGNTSAAVSFSAPASDGGAALTGFTATCGTTSASGVSPIVISGLSNGTTYSCSVKAANDVGSSAASAILSVTPAAPASGAISGGSGSTTAGTPVTTITVTIAETTITFPSGTTAGMVTVTPLTTFSVALPTNLTLINAADVSTTATVATGNIDTCFVTGTTLDASAFANLKVYHLESNAWLDRTLIGSHDFANKRVCARTTSLSPFAVLQAPAAVATTTTAAAAPAASGGGCAVGAATRGPFDPTLPLLVLLAGVYGLRRRRV